MRALAAALLVALPALAAAPKTIAIAYFDNASKDRGLDPLQKGLADMLITDLSEVKAARVVEREKLQALVAEQKLQRGALADPKTAVKVGKLLAAQFILTGTYQLAGEAMRIDARLIEVGTGAVAATARADGKREEFFALEKDLVESLVGSLALPLTLAERDKLRESQTESFEAFEKFSRALDAADQGQAERARAMFEAALQADPEYRRAKDAYQRIGVLKDRALAQQDDAFQRQLRALKPGVADLDSQLFGLLNNAMIVVNPKTVENRAAALSWIFEQGVKPKLSSTGGKPFYFEILQLEQLVAQYPDDGEIAPRVPAVRAYLAKKYGEAVYAEVTKPSGNGTYYNPSDHAHYVAARAAVDRLTRAIAERSRK